MKKLLLFTIALVLMFFAQVQAADVNTVKAAIVKHSIEMGVDPAITLSIAKTESGYRHEARSARGAVGVFQLMPSTARRMGLNPYSLDDNVKGGVMYYKSMYKMFGSMELAIAAYNAGPAVVKRYGAVPPYRETKRFVSQIMSDYHYLKAHTDPAVVAYKNSQKAKQQQVVAKAPATQQVAQANVKQQVAHAQALKQELPKQIENAKIVAQAPEAKRAPIPIKSAPIPIVSFDNDLEAELQESI